MNDNWYLYTSIIIMVKVIMEIKYNFTFLNQKYILNVLSSTVDPKSYTSKILLFKTLTLNVMFYWCNVIQSINVKKCFLFNAESQIYFKLHTLVPQSVNI